MNRISRQILQETGQEPDPATLAQRMEMPEEKIRKILKISKEPISMETPIGDDDDSHLGDFIEDTSTVAPSEAATYASLRDVTKEVLDTLTPREAKVLRMRFGIEMSTDHTLEEVGKQFDVRCASCATRRGPSDSRASSIKRDKQKGPRKRPFWCLELRLTATAGRRAAAAAAWRRRSSPGRAAWSSGLPAAPAS
jgi:hypothetical protein